MITGVVQAREGRIRLKVRGPRKQDREIEAVIDTGYTASLSLPPAVVASLGLRWKSIGRGVLADGSECLFDVYVGTVIWDGKDRRVRSLPDDLAWNDLASIDQGQRRTWLRSIAAMNLKKSTGGHTTVAKEMRDVAKADKLLLQEQFHLYDAELIICCGSETSDSFRKIILDGGTVNRKTTRRGVPYYRVENQFVIEYSHPEARVSDNLLYYGIIDAVREILPHSPRLANKPR